MTSPTLLAGTDRETDPTTAGQPQVINPIEPRSQETVEPGGQAPETAIFSNVKPTRIDVSVNYASVDEDKFGVRRSTKPQRSTDGTNPNSATHERRKEPNEPPPGRAMTGPENQTRARRHCPDLAGEINKSNPTRGIGWGPNPLGNRQIEPNETPPEMTAGTTPTPPPIMTPGSNPGRG